MKFEDVRIGKFSVECFLDVKNFYLSFRGFGFWYFSFIVGGVRFRGVKVKEREGRGSGIEGRRSLRLFLGNKKDV